MAYYTGLLEQYTTKKYFFNKEYYDLTVLRKYFGTDYVTEIKNGYEIGTSYCGIAFYTTALGGKMRFEVFPLRVNNSISLATVHLISTLVADDVLIELDSDQGKQYSKELFI